MCKIYILTILMASIAAALHVTNIAECPALPIRDLAPEDITDLRPDDIKIFGALGDSVLAGYGVNNVNPGIFGLLNTTSLIEYRGLNYLMGGDSKAITVANFMKHYSPQILGSSKGFHELRKIQEGKPNLYIPHVDNLNAAKSAAKAQDLQSELEYLVKTFKESSGVTDSTSDAWKMMTIHIGANDLCNSCKPEFLNTTSAEVFGGHVENAVKYLRTYFPNNTLVNLVGTFNIADIHQIALKNLHYCSNRSILQPCSCLYSSKTPDSISKLAREYDSQLKTIAKRYAPKPNSRFGVIFSPLSADFVSAPVEILSNIDCFHPSLLGHEWLAKVIWNQFFVDGKLRSQTALYNNSGKIYCPTEKDRIQVLS